MAFASGSAPNATAELKTRPEDFLVDEILGFEPSGEGEHLYLHVKARDYNTEYLLEHIARNLGVAKNSVVYSGQKDRYAVTTQWFSVHLPGNADIDVSVLENENVTILAAKRNLKKLRRGAHKGNKFTIRLKNIAGNQQDITAAIEDIQRRGFPNYFGPQRFGRDENNIATALASVAVGRSPKKRFQRSIVFSSLRSMLFNLSLSQRIEQGSWRQQLDGDVFALSGTESFFSPDTSTGEAEQEILERLSSGDIAIAGVLFGDGDIPQSKKALEVLAPILETHQNIVAFLIKQRVAVAVRPLSVLPKDFSFEWGTNDELELSFTLPKGAFATSLLREFVVC
ncbi:hypothetical protein A9Q99_05365 [Gammaproteobacteria bacterium 45_16_T64]|nr:hypothetical protein A9Q99_05365 [Gammaproteobacteria bacterium 45_16_T64]